MPLPLLDTITINDYSVDERTMSRRLPTPQKYIDFLYYAVSLGHEFINRDYMLARSGIDLYMINYIVNGEAYLTYENEFYHLKKGDLTFIHLEPYNTFQPVGDGLEIYYFHLLGGQMRTAYDHFTAERGNVLHDFPEEIVRNTFETVISNVDTPNFAYISSKKLHAMLTDILEYAVVEKKERYPQLVEDLIIAIRNIQNASLEKLADKFGYSLAYLERVFKKYTGITLREQVLRYKYNIACNMLQSTNMTVDAIAKELSYADSKGLICLFKKMGGCTPLMFRKKANERAFPEKTLPEKTE